MRQIVAVSLPQEKRLNRRCFLSARAFPEKNEEGMEGADAERKGKSRAMSKKYAPFARGKLVQ